MPSLDTLLAQTIDRSAERRALALYVHIPFCRTKCHFCDWVADIPVRRLRYERPERTGYLAAICRQTARAGELLSGSGYVPTVMYWGGGTPTRLEVDELVTIRRALDAAFDLSGLQQWSMESTPDCASPDKLASMQRLGLDRVSLGIQSLDDDHLRRAGRGHDSRSARRAIELVKEMGFTFNVDLILGFPGESTEQWLHTLRCALEYEPPHVSIYPYRATEQTIMASQIVAGRAHPSTADALIETYESTARIMREASYYEYVLGYWIRNDKDVDVDAVYKYNMAGDKLGFGSGAESVMGHHLIMNESAAYEEYVEEPLSFGFAEKFSLANPLLLANHLGGALMTREGIHFERFERFTGLPFDQFRKTAFMRRWFDDLRALGASFRESAESVAIAPELVHEVYIRYLTAARTIRPLHKQGSLLPS